MDVPAEVLIHNAVVGMKGKEGTLLQIHPQGYYELNCRFGERLHRMLLPVEGTVLIAQEVEETVTPPAEAEIER